MEKKPSALDPPTVGPALIVVDAAIVMVAVPAEYAQDERVLQHQTIILILTDLPELLKLPLEIPFL